MKLNFFISIFVVSLPVQIGLCAEGACYRFCEESPCTCSDASMFQCKNGQCIPFEKYQDYTIDCDDKSDEATMCCSDQFKCDTKDGIGRCIDSSLLDNGQVDCLDQTDETSVNQQSCKNFKQAGKVNGIDYYQCTTVPNGSTVGKCIPISAVLDAIENCPNADDEDPSLFDECKLSKDKCDDNAVCTNIPEDTYACTCKSGYTGNGYTCVSFENVQQSILGLGLG